jgi:predicted glycosyltransferase involved in capsule biosynthesis
MTSTETTLQSPKYEMPELAFILHYRKDSEDREKNLRNVLKFLKENFEANIVVVAEHLQRFDAPHWIVRNFKVRCTSWLNDDEFKKCKSFNDGAAETTEKILCFWDVDVIIDPKFINTSYQIILEGKADHVYPFNGTFIDVNKELFPELLDQKFDLLNELYRQKHEWLEFASGESPGGCNMISREAFERIEGYDERFIGWGFEDNDFYQRSLKANNLLRFSDPDAICWHMHHDQAIRTENPHYMRNLQIYNENVNRI